MRTTFSLDNNRHLVSSIAPKAQPMALRTGQHVRVTSDIPFTPYGTLPKGACGVVGDVWPENGTIAIRFSKPYPALAGMDNTLVLCPFDNEDEARALQARSPIYAWAGMAVRHIAPRLAIALGAFAVWNYFVLAPQLTWTPITDPHAGGTLLVFLTTGLCTGIKALLEAA